MSLRPLPRARRFGRSLVARAPDSEATSWAHSFLSDRERRLFDQMAAVDRSHSIGVARGVVAHLDRVGLHEHDAAARWIVAAALTHDVGKTVAGLGTYGRVVATLSEAVGGASMGAVWAERSGMTRKVGLYLQYPALGADLLAVADSDERVVAWAAEHHEPEEEWTVPLEAGRLLRDADDDAL